MSTQAMFEWASPDPLQIPHGCPVPSGWPPAPDWWDVVVVAFSGGIDSQAMLLQALETYPKERILAVFNDTGDDHTRSNRLVDWAGTHDFVTRECEDLGVPLIVTHGREILTLTEARGMWSDAKNRLCTSTTKRDQTDKLLRGLGAKRILLLTGELAEESPARAKKPEWQLRTGALAPTKGRLVLWHRPMLRWTKEDEILYIWSRGRDIAATYYAGWDRLSCRFCFFLTWERQVLSFVAYPNEAAEYVALEERIGHKSNLSYRYGDYVGYRAVWEFVYGPWGTPAGDPTPQALQVVERLRTSARAVLQGLKEGRQVKWKRYGGCA